MSKFDYSGFIYFYNSPVIAFNAKKYTRDSAMPIAMVEMDEDDASKIVCAEAWCYAGFGVYEDGDRGYGYWLTEDKKKNSFPVLVFSLKGREWPEH